MNQKNRRALIVINTVVLLLTTSYVFGQNDPNDRVSNIWDVSTDSKVFFGLLLTQVIVLLFGVVGGYFKLRQDKKLLMAQTESKFAEIEKEIRSEKGIEHLQNQLSKFYGPINMLLLTNKTLMNKSKNSDIWERVRNEILIPNNLKIVDIVMQNIHLHNGDDVPQSYADFFSHAFIFNLYKDSGFSKEYLEKDALFPTAFREEIARNFSSLKEQYKELINEKS